MPTLIATHSVFISRPRKDGRKDPAGNPVHERVKVPIGEPFDFTDEEAEDIRRSSPGGLREPVNEGSGTKEEQEAEEAVQKAREAAAQNRGAPGDAANVARTGAHGKGARRQPANEGRNEAPEGEEEL
jgi:hypothetical protein